MSAFIISKENMDIVVDAIVREGGLDGYSSLSPNELGQQLFAMNLEAIHARYPDTKNGGMMPGPCDTSDIFDNYHAADSVFSTPTPAQYKAISCLLYQCSEGKVPERTLFKSLQRFADSMSYQIISSLPEYEAAPWG